MGQQCWKGESVDKEKEGKTAAGNSADFSRKVYEAAIDDGKEGECIDDGVDVDVVYRRIPASDCGLCSVSGVGEGYFVCGAEDGSLALVKGGSVRTFKAHTGDVRRLFFCKAQNMLASCSRDKVIKLWNVSNKTSDPELVQTFEGHTLGVANCCADRTGKRIVSGSRDTTVRLWDVETGDMLHVKKTPRNLVHCLAWLDTGGADGDGSELDNVVVQGGENLKLYLWDVRGDKLNSYGTPITGVSDQPVCMLRNPANGLQVFVGYKGFDEASAVIRLWDFRKPGEVARYSGHNKCLTDMSTTKSLPGHPDHTLVSCSQDRTLRVWPSIFTGLQEGTSTQLSFEGAPTDMTTIDDTAVVVTTEGQAFAYQFDAKAQQYSLSASYVSRNG